MKPCLIYDEARMDQGGGLSGFDDDYFSFNFKPSNDELNSFFDGVNEVVFPTMETEGDIDILKVPPQTTDQMAHISANLDSTEWIPPLTVPTPAIMPSESDLPETLASQLIQGREY